MPFTVVLSHTHCFHCRVALSQEKKLNVVSFVSMSGSLETVSMASDQTSEEEHLDIALANMTVEGKLSL